MSFYDVPCCDDCGISLSRHGGACGVESWDTRAPDYGAPLGWRNTATGELYPTAQPGQCRDCAGTTTGDYCSPQCRITTLTDQKDDQ